jgi:bacterioferritin (cytochrome b1)
MLEVSRAVKCPSLRYHLAGMKCVQLALTDQRLLETIFADREEYIDDLREITEDMFTIEQVNVDERFRAGQSFLLGDQ